MDAQIFLYWSLAIGFIVLVVFMCLALYYVIRILKDVADTTSNVREAVEVVNDNVITMAKKVTVTAEQVGEYLIKPLAAGQTLMDKIKPLVDMMQKKSDQWQKNLVDMDEDDGKRKKTKKKTTKRGKK